jgi:hypothetical protein
MSKHALYTVLVCALFVSVFAFALHTQLPKIFDPQFHEFDEVMDSTVSSNLSRKAFPPMLRINPISDAVSTWVEGPYWQHVPPLPMYIPALFYKVFHSVSVQLTRLSYDTILFLIGIGFILMVSAFDTSLLSTSAALIALVIWLFSTFTLGVFSGGMVNVFGQTDFGLAGSVVASFGVMLWYLKETQAERRHYSLKKLTAFAAIVTLPLLVKSLLGAIAPAIFFILVIYDNRNDKKKIFIPLAVSLAMLAGYCSLLYFSSPQTFAKEILVPFYHFSNYQSWGRPWYFYITDYIPAYYLSIYSPFVYLAFIVSALYFWKKRESLSRRTNMLLSLSLVWFLWNIITVSIVESKSPNFIFQSYLFFLFFTAYCLLLIIKSLVSGTHRKNLLKFLDSYIVFITIVICAIMAYSCISTAYAYSTYGSSMSDTIYGQNVATRYYALGQEEEEHGVNSASDLFIIDASDSDCVYKFYLIFLTGADSRTLDELHIINPPPAAIAEKYKDVHFIVRNSAKLLSISIPHTVTRYTYFTDITFPTSGLPTSTPLYNYLNKTIVKRLPYVTHSCSTSGW